MVVHGGGPDIPGTGPAGIESARSLTACGSPTRAATLDVTGEMVLVGKVNKEIVAQLHVAGVAAVGLRRG